MEKSDLEQTTQIFKLIKTFVQLNLCCQLFVPSVPIRWPFAALNSMACDDPFLQM